ncbi:hypothetical protein HYY74_00590 [Candidatus Woesearchaeota archaeon]|nr:hypothetical protein [Candidatus Woesearchaeota archaeon]
MNIEEVLAARDAGSEALDNRASREQLELVLARDGYDVWRSFMVRGVFPETYIVGGEEPDPFAIVSTFLESAEAVGVVYSPGESYPQVRTIHRVSDS